MTGGTEEAGLVVQASEGSTDEWSGASQPQDQGTGISPFALLNVLLRHNTLVGITLAVAIVGGVIWGATRPVAYSARSSFLPNQENAAQSRLAGMAAQFGVAGISTGGGQSVAFYRELVTSRELRTAVATTTYTVGLEDAAEEQTLAEVYEIPDGPPDLRASAAAAKLQENMSVSTDPDADLITISVRAGSQQLATAINGRILDLVAEFNLEKRQSRAEAERRFAEERRAEAERTLMDAEAELRAFLESNRSFETSPQLVFEHGRLVRRVQLQQDLYASMAQAYEQARLDEIRDTPVITIIDPPRGSLVSRPRPLLGAVYGAALGLPLAIALAFFIEYMRRQQYVYPNHYEEFTARRRKAGSSIARRWLRRILK